MARSLYDLLASDIDQPEETGIGSTSATERYLTRLVSLRISDLTSTESQSLAQIAHSNLLSIQALASRTYKSAIASSDQLSTLRSALPTLKSTALALREEIQPLDQSSSTFATKYSRARAIESGKDDKNNPLQARKQALLLSSQSTVLQDILELPSLLRSSITSASATSSNNANYTQALDLYAHIKRLHTLYPESDMISSIQAEADNAMKDMTTSLLNALKTQNLRLAAAIRTIGWLRRVIPRLASPTIVDVATVQSTSTINPYTQINPEEQSEGCFGALFLTARLSTFLSMTIDGLAPLRDLADQESDKRRQMQSHGSTPTRPQPGRRTSAQASYSSVLGHQTERYLKRYIEIFREHSFSTIQMYRSIFPPSSTVTANTNKEEDVVRLPSALASFPLHLAGLLMETLQTYLPNITDSAARESLLVQVLYAANSLGRLGADFSMMISLLDLPSSETAASQIEEVSDSQSEDTRREKVAEPEWYRIIQKHKMQAARLDAMASGRGDSVSRAAQVPVN